MLKNREGREVPQVTFKVNDGNEWHEVTSAQLFKGKRVIAFALPGAFTPVCSANHLPRYDELAPLFRQNGVDDIVCIAVNDTFVMNAWGKAEGVAQVTLIPDGNGEFSAGMGMLVDKSELGYGQRSWRYSMLVEDGVIRKMFIEPDKAGDPFEVSDADTMLRFINPQAEQSACVTLFTRDGCPYCARAKEMLREHGIEFEEIVLGRAVTGRSLRAVTGHDTVPQAFVDGRRIGGSEELAAYLHGLDAAVDEPP